MYFQFAPYLADLMFQPIYFRLWQDSYFSKQSEMVLFYLKLMSFLHLIANSVLLDLGYLILDFDGVSTHHQAS